MSVFGALNNKLKLWQSHQGELFVRGVSTRAWSFIYRYAVYEIFAPRKQVIIASTPDEAEIVWDELKHLPHAVFFPALGHSPYSSVQSSEASLMQRLSVLAMLVMNPGPCLVVTSFEGANLKLPPPKFFLDNHLKIQVDDIISPHQLAEKLVLLGYRATPSIEEPGTFSRKGGIFDIFPVGSNALRIHYFDDLIESMNEVDSETQKSLADRPLQMVQLNAAPGIFVREDFARNLRENLPQPQPQFKNRYESRKNVFKQLSQGDLFENYPVFSSLFFDKNVTLLDYFGDDVIVIEVDKDRGTKEWELTLGQWEEEFAQEMERNDSFIILPSPEKLAGKIPSHGKRIVVEPLNVLVDLERSISQDIQFSINPLRSELNTKIQAKLGNVPDNKFEYIKAMLGVLSDLVRRGEKLLVVAKNESSRKEIEFLFQENGIPTSGVGIFWHTDDLAEGFYYRTENLWVLGEADLFTHKQKKLKKAPPSNPDLFAEQIATLKAGDYVVHRDFGIGIYRGMETLKVADQESDFLVIEYENRDKVYVPVYRLSLVQKHADAAAGAKIASLQSKKFSELKAKARQSVKKLAFDLLRMQAERKLSGGFPFSAPDHSFKEFEMSFPFEETPDQLRAIEDVLGDMQTQAPMDRLVCGDVGFGKTEVAMRAAYKAVLDKKQVAVLVPTTVLALQHFHSFKSRFKEFAINVEMLSRFKTAKESEQVLAQLKEGRVDIVVGTHALLSEKVVFHDLGLVVIDEEHRFGVNHKEKLKVMKQGVDVMTMTATPIPRTMQMAFIGVRDMSIIQTAPPRRQSIKSYLIKEDDLTIKSAVEKELARGGQVFYVHNRVHDIEEHEIYLKKLVPKARITVTHGQMPEKELEKRINDFYDHKSDILLSTTIIESGIDIPNANTMIIDRADTYGLAQLHQLRGRIGRSDRKAYCYFVVPEHRVLTDIASRRLQALQTYADVGSGFSLASCDLEIRGAGDILGAEQHGHIDQIGLELYMDLLQEAVQELRGEHRLSNRNIEVQSPYEAFIPHGYMSDHGTRLKYYKRLSNANTLDRLEEIENEMADIFGLIPKELGALLNVLKARIWFRPLAVRLIKISGSSITLFFDQETLGQDDNLRDRILNLFMGKPKLYKINPDSSVQCLFKETVGHREFLEFGKHVAGQMGA